MNPSINLFLQKLPCNLLVSRQAETSGNRCRARSRWENSGTRRRLAVKGDLIGRSGHQVRSIGASRFPDINPQMIIILLVLKELA